MSNETISPAYPFAQRQHESAALLLHLDQVEELPLNEAGKESLDFVEERLTRSTDLWQDLSREFDSEHNGEKPITSGIEPLFNGEAFKAKTTEFFLEYFLTPEGQQKLKDTFSLEELVQFGEVEHVARFLSSYDYYSKIKDKEFTKALTTLSGASKKYVTSEMAKQLISEINLEDISNPTQFTIIRNPDIVMSRLKQFRELNAFHRKLERTYKDKLVALNTDNQENSLIQAKLIVLAMQSERLNEMIAESEYPLAAKVLSQAQIIQNDPFASYELKAQWQNFADQTHKLFTIPQDVDKRTRTFSRLDKLSQGIGSRYPTNTSVTEGDHHQLDDQTQTLTQNLSENTTNLSEKYMHADSITTTAEQWIGWAEKYLSHLNLLSSIPNSEYDKDRAGPASDNLWQVVTRHDKTNVGTDPKQKIIYVPGVWNKNLPNAIATLDHEIRHAIQHVNKSKLKLAIFDHVGLGRSSSYAEAGAISWETAAYREFFDYERTTNPDYPLAAIAKIKGGSLKDSARAFFDSYSRKHPEESEIKRAERAVDRAMRFYRKSGILDSQSPYLTNSQPLAYLEQELLAQTLNNTEYDWLLNFSGLNLQNARRLQQIGKINLKDILIPKQRPSQFIQQEIEELINKASPHPL